MYNINSEIFNSSELENAHINAFKLVTKIINNPELYSTKNKNITPELIEELIPNYQDLITTVELSYGVKSNSIVKFDSPVKHFEYKVFGETKVNKDLQVVFANLFEYYIVLAAAYVCKKYNDISEFLKNSNDIQEFKNKFLYLYFITTSFNGIDVKKNIQIRKFDVSKIIRTSKSGTLFVEFGKNSMMFKIVIKNMDLEYMFSDTLFKNQIESKYTISYSRSYQFKLNEFIINYKHNDLIAKLDLTNNHLSETNKFKNDYIIQLYNDSQELLEAKEIMDKLRQEHQRLENEIGRMGENIKSIQRELVNSSPVVQQINNNIDTIKLKVNEIIEQIEKIEP